MCVFPNQLSFLKLRASVIRFQFYGVRSFSFLAVILCFSVLLPQLASGGVIDQSQPIMESNGISPINTTVSGQSFIPSVNNISGARVGIIANQTSPITFEIYSSIGPGSTPLATAVSPTGYTGPDWAEATFSSPIAVVPGTTYYLVFSGTSIGSPPFAFFGGTSTDTYANGFAIVNPNFEVPSLFNGVRAPGNTFGGDFDFAFETLSAVPEPTTGLTCLVFFCMMGTRHRRRRNGQD